LFEIDPNYIGPEAWGYVSVFVTNIWLFVLSIFIFAANMVIGHNMIPSLIESHHIPKSLGRIRIPVYAIAIAAFASAIFFVIRAFQGGYEAIGLIYPDYWI
jgi:Na+-translocating ferredoxin:NAD+ oxidoreductase RnfE subunit